MHLPQYGVQTTCPVTGRKRRNMPHSVNAGEHHRLAVDVDSDSDDESYVAPPPRRERPQRTGKGRGRGKGGDRPSHNLPLNIGFGKPGLGPAESGFEVLGW